MSLKHLEKLVPNATVQVTSVVGWQRQGLVYRKNEVFLDVVDNEAKNLLLRIYYEELRT